MRLGLVYSLFFFVSNIVISQQWVEVGPFHGELKNGNYYHSMGLVDAIWLNPENHEHILMATNSSGIWSTTDRGKTWECKTDKQELVPGMGSQSIVRNPSNIKELLSGAGNYVYGNDTYENRLVRSYDEGNTWQLDPNFINPQWNAPILKIHYHKEKLYILTSHDVLVSLNNGKTWESIFSLDEKNPTIINPYQDFADVEIFSNNNILLTSSQKWGNQGEVWYSKNGEDFVQISSQFKDLESTKIMGAKLTESQDSIAYLGITTSQHIFLYKTTSYGEKFELVDKIKIDHETGDGKVEKFEIEISLKDPNKLYVGLIEFFEWTKETHLTLLSPTANISETEHDDVRYMSLHLDPNTNKEFVLMGNDGGISVYYPAEKKFESLNGQKLPTLQIYNMGITQFNNPNIIIGTQDNGTFEYSGEDKKWSWIAGGDGGASWVSTTGRKRFYCINASINLDNGGVRKVYYTPNTAYSSWFLDFPAIMNEKEDLLYYGSSKSGNAQGARIFISEVETFKQSPGKEIKGVGQIGEIEIDPISPSTVYIASGDMDEKKEKSPRFLKSIDYGNTYTDLSFSTVYSSDYKDTTSLHHILDYRIISSIEMDPTDDEIVYITLTGYRGIYDWSKQEDHYRVLKSYDGGQTWEDYSNGLPKKYPAHKIIKHPSSKELLFCGTDDGIYYRSETMNSWQILGGGFPKNTVVTDIEINYCEEEIYVSTYGRSVWKTKIPEFKKTEIKVKENDTIYYPTYIKSNLLIKNKTTLVVKNDLILAKNCKITIEPKATLILDGGSIMAKCNDDWNKLEIKQKKFLWIFPSKKGKIEKINEGKLFGE